MKIFKIKKRIEYNKAFTLVETLVSVSIFSMAVVAMMVFLGQGLSDIGYVKQKITAEYLAQEGIEYMRNLRDTYMVYSTTSQDGWNSFGSKLFTAKCEEKGCYFDDSNLDYSDPAMPITKINITACSNINSCPILKYSTSGANAGRYNYSSGTDTTYRRRISLTSWDPDQAKIISVVTWTQNSQTHSVTFSENLFRWIE